MLKQKPPFFVLSSLLVATLLWFSLPSMTLAQSETRPETAEFTIVLETSSEGVHLTCEKGCAWTHLAFNADVGDDPQGIDRHGMTPPLKEDRAQSDPAGFMMTIQRTEKRVHLKGYTGTAWTDLTFRPVPAGGQAIDQNGMTRLASRDPDG